MGLDGEGEGSGEEDYGQDARGDQSSPGPALGTSMDEQEGDMKEGGESDTPLTQEDAAEKVRPHARGSQAPSTDQDGLPPPTTSALTGPPGCHPCTRAVHRSPVVAASHVAR